MKESNYEKKEKSCVLKQAVRLMSFLFLFIFQSIISQDFEISSSFEQFDSYFRLIENPIIIDDITVRYSENEIIPYNIINEFTTDKYGRAGIVVRDEQVFKFYAIGKIVLNEEITFYIFSMESKYPEETVYSAYVAQYEDIFFNKMYSVYHSSDIYKLEENYGTYIDINHWVKFNIDQNTLEYSQLDEEGYRGNTYEPHSIDVRKIKRINPYRIKFDREFYSRTQVLMPFDWINNFKPTKILVRTNNSPLNLKKSYFVDFLMGNNDTTTIYYLNYSTATDLFSFEIVKRNYRGNNFTSDGNISQYQEKPDGKFYLEYNELTNHKLIKMD